MEELTPDQELDIRISNQEMIINAAQMELNVLLLEKKKLKSRNPIGFTLNQKDGKRKKD